jgi:hypothetical protein
MASDTSSFESLDWSEPDRNGCTFEAAGWSCRSTGFLWFSEFRTGEERLYPCPRCNSELFLAKATRRVGAAPSVESCICCGSNVAELAYECTVDELRIQKDIRLGLHCAGS